MLVSPCDAIVGACGSVVGTELIQVKGFPYTLQDLLGDPELVAHLPRRALRHAAAHLRHVPSFPRAARLPRRAGDLHLRRHLERQSDRAPAHREALLQERAGSDPNQAGGDRPRPHPGAGRGDPGRQHPAALPRSPARSRSIAGPTSFRAMRRSGRARRWAGFSTGRPSSCSRRTASRCATTCRRERVIRMGQPLMRLP